MKPRRMPVQGEGMFANYIRTAIRNVATKAANAKPVLALRYE
jgi:hypothetical protein